MRGRATELTLHQEELANTPNDAVAAEYDQPPDVVSDYLKASTEAKLVAFRQLFHAPFRVWMYC